MDETTENTNYTIHSLENYKDSTAGKSHVFN